LRTLTRVSPLRSRFFGFFVFCSCLVSGGRQWQMQKKGRSRACGGRERAVHLPFHTSLLADSSSDTPAVRNAWTQLYTCIYNLYLHIHTHTHAHISRHTYMRTYVRAYLSIHVHRHMSVHACMHACIYMYVYTHVKPICIFVHKSG